MSYTINNGITDREIELESLRQIRERFPDARLERGNTFWVTELLKAEECDHVQIGPHDVVRVGILVGGRMVAMPFGGLTVAGLLLKLQQEAPEQLRALALFAAGAK